MNQKSTNQESTKNQESINHAPAESAPGSAAPADPGRTAVQWLIIVANVVWLIVTLADRPASNLRFYGVIGIAGFNIIIFCMALYAKRGIAR